MSVVAQVERKLRKGLIVEDAPPKPTGKVLECLLCENKYSKEDIEKGNFQIATLICSFCYARMQNMPYEKSCFGKPSLIALNGKKYFGYNPKAEECSRLCPDRSVCRRIVWPV